MQQVYYANGKVWGALDTRMSVGGQEQAGIAWFIVKPSMIGQGKVGPQSAVVNQGYLGVAGGERHLSRPRRELVGAGSDGVYACRLNDLSECGGHAVQQLRPDRSDLPNGARAGATGRLQ